MLSLLQKFYGFLQVQDEPLPPIHQLPVEILGEVFKHYLQVPRDRIKPVDEPSVTAERSSDSNPIILGHICHYWRAVSLSMPTLWSSLAINKPIPSHIPIIQLWLERAGECPLSFSIHQYVDVDAVQGAATSDILVLLLKRIHRWRHIELRIIDDIPDDNLCNLPMGILGMLESADLEFRGWRRPFADRLWQMIHSSTSLRRVRWGNRYLLGGVPMHAPWAQLIHIRMGFVSLMSLEDFLEILRYCRQLKVLHCQTNGYWETPFQFTPVLLPNLAHLHVIVAGGYVGFDLIVRHLTLPSLRSLSLERDRIASLPSSFANSPQNLIIRSGNPPKTVSLSDWGPEEDDLTKVLELPHVQNLTRLDLCGIEITDRTVKHLTHSPDRIIPCLQALTLSSCLVSSTAVSAMVLSRSPRIESVQMHCICCQCSEPVSHNLAYLKALPLKATGCIFPFNDD